MMLDEVLKANEDFVKDFEPKKMSHMPQEEVSYCNMHGYQTYGVFRTCNGN